MSRKLNVALLFISLLSHAQLPESEVWLFKIEDDKKTGLSARPVGNVSSKKGYDNQPAFSADSKKLYYVSSNGGTQTDIIIVETGNKKSRSFIQTQNSEYSPIHVGGQIACVAVEPDSSQKIQFFEPENGTLIRSLQLDSVGYHCFLNSDSLVYYKLGGPSTLRLHVQSTGEDRWIADKVTRSLFSPTRTQLVYASADNGMITVYLYDFLLRKGRILARYASPSEDFFYNQRFGVLRAEQSRILQFEPVSNSWKPLFDLAGAGIKSIGRIRISADGKFLAIVEKN